MICTVVEPGEPIAEQDVKLTPADDFQRYSLAGFIEVKSIAPIDTDRFPPSRVTDLEVTGASYDDSSVTLEWTAVGDNLDKGTGTAITKLFTYSVMTCMNKGL